MKEKKSVLKSLFVILVALGLVLLVILLYPFWRLFAWVVNLIGVKGIRNINGNLETPVVFYEHPKTKRRVVFVATIHLAEAEYFTALQRLIESLSGYRVLFEGVGKLTPQEEQSLTKKERVVARYFDRLFRTVREIGETMSLQHQREGLVYEPSWVNTDTTMYNLIRLFAQHNIRFLEKEEKDSDGQSDDGPTQPLMRWLINRLFSRFVPVAVIVNTFFFFSKEKRLAKKFILESRNEEAVRGINAHLLKEDVVTIWGAGHLRGIDKWLKQVGFHEVRQEWFTAYHVRDYSLLGCLKKMIATRKAASSAATTSKNE